MASPREGEPNGIADRAGRVREGPGERQHERIDDRADELLRIHSGFTDCIAQLLLVDPTFGVLTDDMDPDRLRFGIDPVHGIAWGSQIQRRPDLINEFTGAFDEFGQQAGTQAAVDIDPGRVPSVDEGEQLIPIGEITGGRWSKWVAEVIAIAGENIDVGTIEVDGQIVNGPISADGRTPPIVLLQALKKRE